MDRRAKWQFLLQNSWSVHYDTEFPYSRLMKTKRLAVGCCQPSLSLDQELEILPVSASVATATSMEPAATVESSAIAMEATITAPEATTVETTMLEAFAPSETAVVIEITPPVVPTTIVATTIETAPVIAVIPRAGANENSTHKIVWPVVSVRRASIRVISIVAVGAYRSGTVVGRADSNADNHSLRMRRNRCQEHANCQQTHIF